jgi:hypothetical protein
MAVRNDFAPGEVLAAADLNDTFGSKLDYPSGGADGNVLTKSGTAAAWSAPEAAGLTLITSNSFSAVSSVSVNGCFSSSYQNYFMACKFATASASDALVNLRFRASGSDDTGTNYSTNRIRQNAGTIGGSSNPSSNSLWTVATLDNGWQDRSAFKLDIFAPQVSTATVGLGHCSNISAGEGRNEIYSHAVQNTTAYDGFSLLVSSGTFGGTIRLYGYKD